MNDIVEESKKCNHSSYTVPIHYLLHDLRGLITIKKLDQLRLGKEIKEKTLGGVDLANLLLKINQKYPHDIEEHFGLRNIIDLHYDTYTKIFFYCLAALYFFGFAAPFTM